MKQQVCCNSNSACVVNEAYSLPSLQSVRRSFPLRGCTAQLAAFSLDIEAAHKTVRVHESRSSDASTRTAFAVLLV